MTEQEPTSMTPRELTNYIGQTYDPNPQLVGEPITIHIHNLTMAVTINEPTTCLDMGQVSSAKWIIT